MLYRRSKGANPAQIGIEEDSVACAESGHETVKKKALHRGPTRQPARGGRRRRTRGPPGRLGWPASWLGRVRGKARLRGKKEQAGGFDSFFLNHSNISFQSPFQRKF